MRWGQVGMEIAPPDLVLEKAGSELTGGTLRATRSDAFKFLLLLFFLRGIVLPASILTQLDGGFCPAWRTREL